MADLRHSTDGPSPLSQEGYDESLLPDFNREFISEVHLQAFANALSAPEHSPPTDDLFSPTLSNSPFTRSPSVSQQNGAASPSRTSIDSTRGKIGGGPSQSSLFITAQNDWAPVNPKKLGGKGRRGSKKKGGRVSRRSRDETREGYLYTLLKWPMLGIVGAWVIGLGASYLLTRLYIWLYGTYREAISREVFLLKVCRTLHCVERETREVEKKTASYDELCGLGEGGERTRYVSR